MLCCVGLFVGAAIGSAFGGPWSFIAPAFGFGIGFLGDMKLMSRIHKGHGGHGGGCCGGNYTENTRTKANVKDPVCGMYINENTTSYKTKFGRETYYFCSLSCESTFKQNPEKYIERTGSVDRDVNIYADKPFPSVENE